MSEDRQMSLDSLKKRKAAINALKQKKGQELSGVITYKEQLEKDIFVLHGKELLLDELIKEASEATVIEETKETRKTE